MDQLLKFHGGKLQRRMIALICRKCNCIKELLDKYNLREYREDEIVCEECHNKPLTEAEDKLLKALFGEHHYTQLKELEDRNK